ncbi:MAG: 3-deoxy-8-phosphooctulonate synthase [Bacteroidia bacterium]|nr:3-deoxy-8-phosphooctulonate synthase [Bacteroidia bacterium]MCX7763860.1 3-deoxy-8-phosphooctulonate synthase [Bacteroidia bacterium]MDW8057705.1 3-deoxy-8-phosphooctulonate synthase [Bacteroidia bacterium]
MTDWRKWFSGAEGKKACIVAGPCVVETYEIAARVAEALLATCEAAGFFYIFKASYRKANRTKASSFQGIGDEKALKILQQIRQNFGVPVLTDVHETTEVPAAAEVVDVLQIPAFLARQTALLQAAGKTGKVVNIKKGQFMSAEAAIFAAEKVALTQNHRIFLTERGTFFGYDDLVVDFRNIPRMQASGYPVLMDATHAVQRPNTGAGITLGERQFVALYAKLGVIAGAQGIFMEVHPNPSASPSDAATMLSIEEAKSLLSFLSRLYDVHQAVEPSAR